MVDNPENPSTRALSHLVGQARGLTDELNRSRDVAQVRHALVTFTRQAREHLSWEQQSRGREMSSPDWWRAYYLARVLDDLETATLSSPINRVSVEHLIGQWLSEQDPRDQN